MSPFNYQRAESVADAVTLHGGNDAFLAGGTNRVDHMRLGIRAPKQLVDISRLPLLVSVAAALDVRERVVRDVRLALGGASHRPHRARNAEAALRGRAATPQTFLAAANEALADAKFGADNAYKMPMLRNTIAAVLSELARRGNP